MLKKMSNVVQYCFNRKVLMGYFLEEVFCCFVFGGKVFCFCGYICFLPRLVRLKCTVNRSVSHFSSRQTAFLSAWSKMTGLLPLPGDALGQNPLRSRDPGATAAPQFSSFPFKGRHTTLPFLFFSEAGESEELFVRLVHHKKRVFPDKTLTDVATLAFVFCRHQKTKDAASSSSSYQIYLDVMELILCIFPKILIKL